MPLPSGTVTFLFTDIEGSTPLWERMPREMQQAVAQHHAILRAAIERNGGQVTQIIGDEFQSAFWVATQALQAALDAQRGLQTAAWGETGPIKVRMGLHTGPAELDPRGDAPYAVSHTLNRAGRVRSAGYGGQILLSQETKDLVERSLPEGVRLRDLGEYQLKGLSTLEHLYQVVARDLAADFPALATGIAYPNNLPTDLTSFIGREREIGQLAEEVRRGRHRLVTLTGAGGTGKTRLALRVCAEALEAFPDGVWLVELAPLGDPGLVGKTIARALGLQEVSGVPMLETLLGYLQRRKLLLALDNCEHLLEECARVVDALLRGCPRLQILATSREILNVSGESSLRVPSLAVVDPEALPGLEELGEVEAVRLFVERAADAAPGFRLGEGSAAAVATICQRLDGIPLAIELAAARVRVMGVEQIAARLKDVFRLLTGGARNVMPRHQTLKAAIDWSYALLAEKEKEGLQRLSVFAGSWTMEAAEVVCAGEGIEADEVLDLLGGMVDKSLASFTSGPAGGGRYRMLETIRQYAHDRLVEGGGGGAVRDRHLAYYVRLGKEGLPHLRGVGQQVAWLERMEEELGNLRLALDWALSGSESGASGNNLAEGMYLFAFIYWFWHIRHGPEGIGWVERLLRAEARQRGDRPLAVGAQSDRHILGWCMAVAACGSLATMRSTSFTNEQLIGMLETAERLCRQLGEAGSEELMFVLEALAWKLNDFDRATRLYEEMLAIARRIQHPMIFVIISTGLLFHGTGVFYQGEIDQAVEYTEQALAISRKIGDIDKTAVGLTCLGRLSYYQGEYSRGKASLNEGIQKYQELGSRCFAAWATIWRFQYAAAEDEQDAEVERQAEEALVFLRETREWSYLYEALLDFMLVEWGRGDYARVGELARERAEVSAANHLAFGQADTEVWLGRAALSQGDLPAARQCILAGARWRIDHPFETGELHDTPPIVSLVWAADALAACFAAGEEPGLAAKLFGAEEEMYSRFCLSFPVRQRREHDSALGSVRQALGEEAFFTAWQAGQALTLEQAIRSAIETVE